MEQGKQELLNTILAEAQAKADATVAEAQAKKDSVLAQAQADQAAYLAQSAQKDEADALDLVTKAATAATMEGKKAYLATKRRILATVYDRLLQQLYALPRDKYLALVDGLLQRYAQEGDTVLVAKDCAITYGDVQSLPIARKRVLKVEYSDTLKGGVVLVSDAMDKDLSFEALCQSVQQDTEMQLAASLFED